MIHDFAQSLRLSQSYANAPWWEEVYRQAFPTFSTMDYVGDCPAQRDGVDRVVNTRSDHHYRIDEKVREQDWDDFFLEYWSVYEERVPGWVAKDLAADFIAYAFVPSRRCYLLPFPLLRRAWAEYRFEWVERYGERRVPNRNWTTIGVPVPIPVVVAALGEAQLIRWGEQGPEVAAPRAGAPAVQLVQPERRPETQLRFRLP